MQLAFTHGQAIATSSFGVDDFGDQYSIVPRETTVSMVWEWIKETDSFSVTHIECDSIHHASRARSDE